jgi:hypothetical protein
MALKSSVRRSSRLRAELWNIACQSSPRIRWVPSGAGQCCIVEGPLAV